MANEVKLKEDKTTLIIGGVVVAICGVGAYYIWSRNKLLNDLIEAVEDYQLEYEEFMEDGQIDENERGMLDVKRQKINTIIHEIEEKGLIGQAIDLLWTIGIVVSILTVTYIITKIVERYFKRNPPPEAPPGNPYQDATDNTWHPTEDHLVDHYHQNHPTPGTDPAAWDEVWRDIQSLPQWVIDLLASFNLDGLEHWVEHGYSELDPAVQLALKLLLGAAIIIVIALVGWWAGPAIYDKLVALLGKLDAIPA